MRVCDTIVFLFFDCFFVVFRFISLRRGGGKGGLGGGGVTCCLFYCSPEINFNKSFDWTDRVHEIFRQTITVNQCRNNVNKYYDNPGSVYSSNYCQLQQD